MRMYAEIIDDAGTVIVRAEGDVFQDGDLIVLVQSVFNSFRRDYPDPSFVTEFGQAGFTVKFGETHLADG